MALGRPKTPAREAATPWLVLAGVRCGGLCASITNTPVVLVWLRDLAGRFGKGE